MLVTVKGAGVGKSNLAPPEKVAIGRQLMALRPIDGITETDYIFLFIRTQLTEISGQALGATVPGLGRNVLEVLNVPLPPLPEQKRITSLLKKQMAAVERARAAVQAQIEEAQALKAAYLREVFPQPGAKLPKGWLWKKLDDVCTFLDSMRVPVNDTERNQRITGKPKSSLYPYFGANGQVGWIDDYLFDEPLILLAEDGGPFGSITKPISYKISGKSWVNNHAHVLRPNEGYDFDFILHALSIRPDLGIIVTGNTRPKLNQGLARKIPIPIRPIQEQRRISSVLNKQAAVIEKIKIGLEGEFNEIEALPAALLRQAFSGDL